MRGTLLTLLLVAMSGGCKDPEPTTDTDTGVEPPPVVFEGDVVVVVHGAPFLPTGQTEALTVDIFNSDVTDVTWSSSMPEVLSVDGSGLATAHAAGMATVSATVMVEGASVTGTHGIYVQNTIPHYESWRASGHADYSAEAFTHWDEDKAAEVPTSCARCHSTGGFQDYLGADGSEAGVVDAAAALGTAVECAACHNAATDALTQVTFPSGVTVDDLGAEARCMTCHQGRASGDDLHATFAALELEDRDAVSSKLRFTNIHYYPAGATLFAARAGGGFEYEGEVYDWQFRHVEQADVCQECHDPHSLEVRTDLCVTCHEGADSPEALHDIRMIASVSSDYDGDGDRAEGIYDEIGGLREQVLASLQQYVLDRGLTAICYDAHAYPYFFQDTSGDGTCDGEEASYANAYASWSARSVAAAYNYQMAKKDPGSFAHNAKYIIQLLHDSLQDVNAALAKPHDLTALERNDLGHFNGAGQAARHWDDDEALSASCSQCHGGREGIEFYLQYGVGLQNDEPDNGLECETCHVGLPDYSVLRTVDSVTFPSGITIEDAGNPSNMCMSCHQGRESKASVDARIATGSYGFRNVHYLPAGATLHGADAQVGYEYDGKSYSSTWPHNTVPGSSDCTFCHDPVVTDHTFDVDASFEALCTQCHGPAESAREIRGAFFNSRHNADYDGDGSNTEPIHGEIEGLAEVLYAQITAGAAVCYNAHAYPYFFADTNNDGVCTDDERGWFNGWTPALMKATFNYQMYQKDPGAYTHNFEYIGQLLYDSIEDLGGDTDGLVRPEVY